MISPVLHTEFTNTLYGIAYITLSAPLPRYRNWSKTSLSARGRLILDALLFAAIVIASNPLWTGIGVHEWLAGLLIVPALYHLAINWDWVTRTALKITTKLKRVSRANFVVDVALFLASITVMLSGFMVLPGVVPPLSQSAVSMVWHQVHRVSSDLTILAMLIHLVLHAQWIYETALRSVLPKPGRHAAGQIAPARTQGRR